MTQQQHPITPPHELVEQWWDDFNGAFYEFEAITATIFQAGADQELEACCEWVSEYLPALSGLPMPDKLRAARRPKPPSLKEEALEELDGIAAVFRMFHGGDLVCDKIRSALKSIPDPS